MPGVLTPYWFFHGGRVDVQLAGGGDEVRLDRYATKTKGHEAVLDCVVRTCLARASHRLQSLVVGLRRWAREGGATCTRTGVRFCSLGCLIRLSDMPEVVKKLDMRLLRKLMDR